MQSLKINFIYNAILTMSGYIFPFIVYPYVSRTLGVANMGACNFVDSIIEYFTIISMMGMNIIGVREIAKCKGDKNKLSQTFSELFSLNTFSTLFAVLLLCLSILFIKKLEGYQDLLYIGISKLVFNYLLINWFFQGIEDFKFVAIRTIFIKLAFVISVFCFVRSTEDTTIYYGLVAGTLGGNAIINFIYTKRLISIRLTNKIRRSFVIPFFVFGLYWFMNSMYTTLNTAFLGFLYNDTEVGYYTTANKLLAIIMTLFTTLTTVMIPRISTVITKDNNINEPFRILVEKSYNVFIAFIFPLICIVFIFSPEIISIISGKGYEGAIIPLRIISPCFFIMGYDQIIVLQILMPLKQDKLILRNSIIAATVGIFTNLLFVPFYGKIGSSIVQLLAEMTVLLSSQHCVYKIFGYKFPFISTLKRLALSILLFFTFYALNWMLKDTVYVAFVLSCFICPAYIILTEIYIFENKVFIGLITTIKNKSYIFIQKGSISFGKNK